MTKSLEIAARVDQLIKAMVDSDREQADTEGPRFLETLARRALIDWEHAKGAARLQPFRAGDHVQHFGSGETWVLACDQEGDEVVPAGWPESCAPAAHCRLVKAATDDERRKMLEEASAPGGEYSR